MINRITRRGFLSIAGISVISFRFPEPTSATAEADNRPNLLFIMADDHTSQAWGCYGSRLAKFCPTENIDRLRSQGALLTNCFCTNSICVPSRASILTGQYSHINGAGTLAGRLDSKTDNVAKHLQASGYETAIIGKWHLKEKPSGFDYYNVLRGQGRYHNPVLYETGADWKKGGRIYEGHSTDVITSLALEWLNNRKDKSKKFCLMLHFKAVHEPFYSHDRYRDLYKDVMIPEPGNLMSAESPSDKCFDGWPLEILTKRYKTNPSRYAPPRLEIKGKDPQQTRRDTYQKFIKDYLRTVAGIDYNIGRILKYIDGSGLENDTAAIYTSDQGYFLGEHNMFDKRFMLEESLRMPFIIRYPREIEPGATVNDIILNIDFAELFLDYARAKVPETMQGTSFRENLRGNTPENWRDAMYYRYWENSPQRPAHYGIRTHKYKLIYYYGLNSEACWELYDLKNDPLEQVNIYNQPENRDIIKQLKKKLDQLQKYFKDDPAL